jgi:hypothetical protein
MPTCRAIWRSKWQGPRSPTGVSSRLQAAAAPPITITARLYLGGAYLRLVSEQAIIEGGRRDPDLSAVIVRLTQDLLARRVDNSIDSLPLSVSR